MQMWLKMLGKASTQQPELPSVYSYCTSLTTAFSRRFSYRDGLKMHTSGCAANSFINEFIYNPEIAKGSAIQNVNARS